MRFGKYVLLIAFTFVFRPLIAGEGMWIPLLLNSLNEAEMQSMGMKMTAEDIYSVNKGSLKDAIAHFGGFCTSEVISSEGLLLTNHHCGYGAIQSHTTLENNFLENGFWAKTRGDELPNKGLFATFIVRIEDVSEQVLVGVTEGMDSKDRQSQIDKNLQSVKTQIKHAQDEDVVIRPFYKGNQYFAFVTITYPDVRLVGTPPDAIGKFGADTDNWVWPRHTGDFALFRIYAGPDNRPAEYSPDNKPYQPKHHLPISMDGVTPDDFTLVFGFPGRTNEYLPSFAIEQVVDVLNPAKINIREKALAILDNAMRKDEATRIKYASKQARIANYWKKWMGESMGIKATDGIGKKKKYEAEFTQRLNANPTLKKKYGQILTQFEKLYADIEPYALVHDYQSEVFGRNIELFSVLTYMRRLVGRYENNGETAYRAYAGRLKNFLEGFYKNYDQQIDQKVFASLMNLYFDEVPGVYIPNEAKQELTNNGGSYSQLADHLYQQTVFTQGEKVMGLLEKDPEKAIELIKGDPAYNFAANVIDHYNEKVAKPYDNYNDQIEELMRVYMKAQMEVFEDRRFYPDANSTLRVTYGKVDGYEPRDAVKYQHQTYLSGVMEKYKPGDYEFDVPERLVQLYQQKDYGPYGSDGKMPVCFIGTNHTTGGNSGSPAVDAHGNLIGLNFDRAWEGTMSDLNYDPSICRNIMVDIRYVLFIVDKFAGAPHLVKEMTLVHPKHAGNSK